MLEVLGRCCGWVVEVEVTEWLGESLQPNARLYTLILVRQIERPFNVN